MTKRHGFLLIELVISMSLAAIISFTLVNTLYRANKASAALDNTTYVFGHAALAHYQLERDITTAFAPIIHMVNTEKVESPTPEKSTENKPISPEQDQEKATSKESKKMFYGTHDGNNNLSTLTFITSSPLATYWSSKTGKPKARIARVIYRLVKDTQQSDTYTLFRQEGPDLDFDAYSPDQSGQTHNYALIKNIKQCTITYKISIEKKAQVSKPDENKQLESKPEIEYKTFTEWGITQQDQTKKEEPVPTLPHMVTVSLTLWDKEHTREHSFNFVYVIAAENGTEKKQISDKKQVQQKPQTLPEKPQKTLPGQKNTQQKQAKVITSNKVIVRTEQRLVKSQGFNPKRIKTA